MSAHCTKSLGIALHSALQSHTSPVLHTFQSPTVNSLQLQLQLIPSVDMVSAPVALSAVIGLILPPPTI